MAFFHKNIYNIKPEFVSFSTKYFHDFWLHLTPESKFDIWVAPRVQEITWITSHKFKSGAPAVHFSLKICPKAAPVENHWTHSTWDFPIHSKHASVPPACTDHDSARVAPKSVERTQSHSSLTSYAFFFFYYLISGITSMTGLWRQVSQSMWKSDQWKKSVEGMCNYSLLSLERRTYIRSAKNDWFHVFVMLYCVE